MDVDVGTTMSMLSNQEEWMRRASAAQAKAAHSYARLVATAEDQSSGQVRRIAAFLASTYNGQVFPFDPYELRAVDVAIGDDMLVCLDALRWAKADLHTLIPDGDRRLRVLIDRWGFEWPATGD